jgi:sugar lactone lactonase YvrE
MEAVLNRLTTVLLLPMLVAGCAAGSVVDPFGTATRIWPEPPQQSRIAFVGEFSSAADLGIREGAWARFIALAAGSSDNGMVKPMAVAAAADGNIIFVADPGARCVHRYNIQRARYRCLSSTKKGPAVFPIALAVTGDGWVFVSDSKAGQLYQAGPGSKYLERFDTSSTLQQPTGIFWDEKTARLYVTDTGAQSIKVFDRNGNLEFTIGERGNLPGLFNFPTYLWIDGDELLVTDSLNFRMQRFRSDGEPVHVFGKNGDKPGDFSRPKGVATDSHGHVYVVDALMHALQIFNRQGDLLLSIGGQGQDEGRFWLPNGIFITGDNKIFVADSYNKRVQVFRYEGPDT